MKIYPEIMLSFESPNGLIEYMSVDKGQHPNPFAALQDSLRLLCAACAGVGLHILLLFFFVFTSICLRILNNGNRSLEE